MSRPGGKGFLEFSRNSFCSRIEVDLRRISLVARGKEKHPKIYMGDDERRVKTLSPKASSFGSCTTNTAPHFLLGHLING